MKEKCTKSQDQDTDVGCMWAWGSLSCCCCRQSYQCPVIHHIWGKQPRIWPVSRATYLEKATELTISRIRILGGAYGLRLFRNFVQCLVTMHIPPLLNIDGFHSPHVSIDYSFPLCFSLVCYGEQVNSDLSILETHPNTIWEMWFPKIIILLPKLEPMKHGSDGPQQ